MARSRTPLSVSSGGASSSLRAWASPSAGVDPSLALAEGRLTPVDRITSYSVMLAEVIEQRGERRQFAADGGIGQLAGLEMLAPGDDVRAGYSTELGRMPQASEN